MQTIDQLLDAAKKAQNLETDMALAKAIGVGRATVSSYRHGRTLPDPVACAALAGLTGIPLVKVIGIVGEARAISREEKAVWRKLATSVVAAFLLLAAYPLPGRVTNGAQRAECGVFSCNQRVLAIMFMRRLFTRLRRRLVRRRRKSHAYLLALQG